MNHFFSQRRCPLLALILPLGLAPWASAAPQQAPDLWVSTTSDVGFLQPDQPEWTDSSLIEVRSGQAPQPAWFEGHWRALGALLPTDIDALAFDPAGGALPSVGLSGGALSALRFSLLSNQGPWRDGDVLQLAAGGGFELVLSEEQLAQELGRPGTSIDLDAMSFDEQGHLLFSLQSDLAGTVIGDLSDGDVLFRDGLGGIQRRLSEADVQAAFTAATGSVSAIGDVLGIHLDDEGLWVSVQAPSSVDGGILRAEGPIEMVSEESLGLGGAELDALAGAPGPLGPMAWVVPDSSGPMRGRIEGATPGGALVVLAAGTAGYQTLPGLGALFLDALDPHLSTVLAGGHLSIVLADGAGAVDVLFDLPAVGASAGWDGVAGWTFQVIDLQAAQLSTPFRLDF